MAAFCASSAVLDGGNIRESCRKRKTAWRTGCVAAFASPAHAAKASDTSRTVPATNNTRQRICAMALIIPLCVRDSQALFFYFKKSFSFSVLVTPLLLKKYIFLSPAAITMLIVPVGVSAAKARSALLGVCTQL